MDRHVENIDEYIQVFPVEVQVILEKMRQTIHEVAPEAQEKISYGMPSFNYLGKVLVYFAAFKSHIGFYALPSGNDAFRNELLPYKTGKGSIQFPLNKPIPYDLIRKIVMFRASENRAKFSKQK